VNAPVLERAALGAFERAIPALRPPRCLLPPLVPTRRSRPAASSGRDVSL